VLLAFGLFIVPLLIWVVGRGVLGPFEDGGPFALLVDFFNGLGMKPKPIPERLSTPVVQVIAEGDYVVVVTVAKMPIPSEPSKTYTTSWFDLWRFKDGKADEHWDNAPLMK